VTREAANVLEQALKLPARQRAELVSQLLRSLDIEEDEEEFDQAAYDAAWDAELRKRIEDLDQGRAKTVPWEEVRRRLTTDDEPPTR
jgi:putative addiction module component (TIGR02574 family)